jgi:hypothetical protein
VLETNRLSRGRPRFKNFVIALVTGLVIAACGGGAAAMPSPSRPELNGRPLEAIPLQGWSAVLTHGDKPDRSA